MSNPIVTIEMESGAVMTGELYPELAPNTVNNFIALANSGFYDGLIFHRVIPGFMIQGGCPQGNGMGGPGYEIDGEFSANGHKNDLKHTLGVLSMARTMAPNSAGSSSSWSRTRRTSTGSTPRSARSRTTRRPRWTSPASTVICSRISRRSRRPSSPFAWTRRAWSILRRRSTKTFFICFRRPKEASIPFAV